MQTTPVTPEQVCEWKRIYAQHRDTLRPNRRSGTELDAYFCEKYPHTPLHWQAFTDAVRENILYNAAFAEKLPVGAQPEIVTYETDGVAVGIDLVTGYFQTECEEIGRTVPIWDDLFVYRGLDEADLQNFYLTAEYIRLCGLDK